MLIQATCSGNLCVTPDKNSYTRTHVERNVDTKQSGDYQVFRSSCSTQEGTYDGCYTIGALELFRPGEPGDTFQDMPTKTELLAGFYKVNRDGEVCLYQEDEGVRVCYTQA